MKSDEVRLTEGDDGIVWTFTCKRAGNVIDLSGPLTVLLYARDDDAAEGTNIVDGEACAVSGDGTAGQATFTFTSASHTTISGTGRVVRGRYKLTVTSESLDDGLFIIEKDAYTA